MNVDSSSFGQFRPLDFAPSLFHSRLCHITNTNAYCFITGPSFYLAHGVVHFLRDSQSLSSEDSVLFDG
jgi:hypothetical protein